jgi:hypothetical protein
MLLECRMSLIDESGTSKPHAANIVFDFCQRMVRCLRQTGID